MRVKDIIKIMDEKTEIFIFKTFTTCISEGHCDYYCEGCEYYEPGKEESDRYRGTAENCPIKLSELVVVGIDNKTREYYEGRKKKTSSVISLEVKYES